MEQLVVVVVVVAKAVMAVVVAFGAVITVVPIRLLTKLRWPPADWEMLGKGRWRTAVRRKLRVRALLLLLLVVMVVVALAGAEMA